jgi:hypothetical protein
MSDLSPLLNKDGSETDIPRSVNLDVDGAYKVIRFVIRVVCRAHCLQRARDGSAVLIEAAFSNRRAQKSRAA